MAITDLIRTMLAGLASEKAQDLGIRFARRRFPELFPYVQATATSLLGRTTKGLPDAYFVRGDGKSNNIEVTSGATWRLVKGHLEREIAKLSRTGGTVAAFVYLSTNPNIKPDNKETSIYLGKVAAAAGIDPTQVHLIWGTGLVEALEHPAMRRILLDFGCQIDPRRFRLVRADETPDGARLASSTHADPFVPSSDDLRRGLVHEPRMLSQVIGELETRKISLVKGLGASGKTVLAWLAGLRWQEQDRPCWYLDLRGKAPNDADFAAACEQDLRALGDPSSLFIVDNCHLDEETARKLFNLFDRGEAQGASLLLLGRELKVRAGSVIWEINAGRPNMLVAGKDDLKGVYTRLATRRLVASGRMAAPPPPPDEILDDWLKAFGSRRHGEEQGADLIMFSAAVSRKLDLFPNEIWTLTQADAVEAMRTHYLTPLPDGEKTNLYALATMQQAEIALDPELLPDRVAGLENAKVAGLVIETTAGRTKRLEFMHSSLASLALLAAGIDERRQKQYIDDLLGLERGPSLSGTALVRFADYGNSGLSHHVQQGMKEDPRYLYASPLELWPKLLPKLVNDDGDWPADFVGGLAQEGHGARIIEQLRALPLGKLPFGLRTVSSQEPFKSRLYPAIAAELCSQLLADLEVFVRRLLGSNPEAVVGLLKFLDSREPFKSGLFPEVADELCRQALADLETFVGRLLGESPEAVVGLLNFLRDRQPFGRRLFPGIATEFCREEGEGRPVHLKALVEGLLGSPPDKMVPLLNFLAGQERFGKGLFPAIAAELCREEDGRPVHLEALAGRLLGSSPEAVVRLLNVLRGQKPFSDKLWPALSARLCQADSLAKLAEVLERSPCEKTVAVLRDAAPFYRLAFEKVRGAEFLAAAYRGAHDDIAVFHRFTRICRALGRDDLAQSLARKIVIRAEPADWATADGSNAQTHLGHVTRMIAMTRGIETDDRILAFLDQVVTPKWLDGLYCRGSTGGVASNLYHVWLKIEPTLHPRFMRPSLQDRLDREAKYLPDAVPVERFRKRTDPDGHGNRRHVLSLLGVTSLFGLRPSVPVRWPNSDLILKAHEAGSAGREPALDDDGLNTAERAFWLGLRTMGSGGLRLARAPREAGDRMLRLWNEELADPPDDGLRLPDHVISLNDAMVAWLNRCQRLAWWLADGH